MDEEIRRHATIIASGLVAETLVTGEADLAILTEEATGDLAAVDILDRRTASHLANAVLGVAVKRGASRPDISTAAHFRQSLIDARSIAFSRAGASGLYIAKLIDTLGIGDAVRNAAVIVPNGFTAVRVLNDEAELAVQQISELMAVDGAEIVGPFPQEFQQTTRFVASQFVGRASPAVDCLMSELIGHNSREAYKSSGLECAVPS